MPQTNYSSKRVKRLRRIIRLRTIKRLRRTIQNGLHWVSLKKRRRTFFSNLYQFNSIKMSFLQILQMKG